MPFLVHVENVAILVWLDEIGKMPQSVRQILVGTHFRKFSHNLLALDYLLIEEHGIYICEAYSPSATLDGDVGQQHYRGDEQKQQAPSKSKETKPGDKESPEKKPQNPRRLVQDARFQSSASLIQYARAKKAAPDVKSTSSKPL
jgi:hypothetical protein